jgi:protein-tyrosine phosphatase
MKILFVCTGNICRSPIAEKMLQQRNLDQGLDLHVSSAGTRALNGQSMHPQSLRVLQERGIDSDGFVSQLLTTRIAIDADLILGLSREHRAVARQLAPVRWKRMYALREITLRAPVDGAMDIGQMPNGPDPTDPRLDIEDPIGKDPRVFDNVADEITTAVDDLVTWIVATDGRHGEVSGPKLREYRAN